MGLDMHLHKKHYVKNWEHNKDEQFQVLVKLNGESHPAIKCDKVVYIEEEVMYWRKANAIHDWFVKNCQDGRDECQESYVDPTKLPELLDTCKKVAEASELDENGIIKDSSVADELLPSRSGFFFGSTDYDQYYLSDIKKTIEVLEKELSTNLGKLNPEYYYRASW